VGFSTAGMIEILLGVIIIILFGIIFFLYRRTMELAEYASGLQFSKKSQSVKYGKMSEHWIPLSEKFPYDKEKFRFLGNPIDGIAFLDDRIVFCEFKSSTSALSSIQKRIKKLVENKKVEWMEMRVK
jgi:predicted Holliday junction resolvase-like endonuclease